MNGDGLVCDEEHGIEPLIESVDAEMHRIAKKNNRDLLVFRDVPLEKYEFYEKVLSKKGYSPALGFTNAVLDIEWDSFDEYLLSRNSKTRHKLKSALTISERLNIRVEISSDYAHLASDMAKLWANVSNASSDYSREKLDEAFFYESGLRLKNSSETILFFHCDKLVAFMWNLVGDEDYHMADWGVDYSFPHYRKANFYRAASVISIQRSIDLKKKRMQLGMTNYVPKKLIGAKMQPFIYFIKHVKTPDLSYVVCDLITDAIEHPDKFDYYQNCVWPNGGMPSALLKSDIGRRVSKYSGKGALSVVDESSELDVLKVGGMYGFYPNRSLVTIDLARKFCLGPVYPSIDNAEIELSEISKWRDAESPFFCGKTDEVISIERQISKLFGKTGSHLFGSGHFIHLAVIPAIVRADVLAIIDDQCNPLIREALQISGCSIEVFRHGDISHLEEILSDNLGKKLFIAIETISSFSGCRADLESVVELKIEYQANLYIDASTSFGVEELVGEGGAFEHADLIVASTFFGAGVDAGFIAADREVIEHIKHSSQHLILSPGVSDAHIKALSFALTTLSDRKSLFRCLLLDVEVFVRRLRDLGLEVLHYEHSIVHVCIGDYMLALAAHNYLLDNGVATSLIGPPIVSPDVSMLRIDYGIGVQRKHIDEILGYMKEIKRFIE